MQENILGSSARLFAADGACHAVDFETRERLDGLILLPGAAIAMDVTITHPEAKSHLSAAMSPLGAARKAENQKFAKYEEKAQAMQMEFFPVAFETHGAMGEHAARMFKRLSQLLDSEAYLGMTAKQAVDMVKAGAAMALQQGNAEVIKQGLRREWSRRIAQARRAHQAD